MGYLIQWIVTLRILSPLIRPLVRLLIGVIAAPLMRVCLRRVVRWDELNRELTKDLEQWVRGSLLLLASTANMEAALFGWVPPNLQENYAWLGLGFRLLLAIGVIEAMPDQDLFPIIHPGPGRLLLPPGRRLAALRTQIGPFCKGLFFRHLDRSSFVLAILAVIQTGPWGWACYFLAIFQFLVIGLVSSKDKALDVLSEFDRQMQFRRLELQERRERQDSLQSTAGQNLVSSDEPRTGPPGDGGHG